MLRQCPESTGSHGLQSRGAAKGRAWCWIFQGSSHELHPSLIMGCWCNATETLFRKCRDSDQSALYPVVVAQGPWTIHRQGAFWKRYLFMERLILQAEKYWCFVFCRKMEPPLCSASFRTSPVFQNKLPDLVMLFLPVILNEVQHPFPPYPSSQLM